MRTELPLLSSPIIVPAGSHRAMFEPVNFDIMRVEINHKPVEVKSGIETLGALLRELEIEGKGRAVAVNNSVVPHAQWDSFALADEMKITVIRAVCGG